MKVDKLWAEMGRPSTRPVELSLVPKAEGRIGKEPVKARRRDALRRPILRRWRRLGHINPDN